MRLSDVLAYSAIGAELLPPVVMLATRSRDSNRERVALWCLVLFLFDMLQIGASRMGIRNNLWLEYFFNPTQAMAMFAVMMGWQVTQMGRLAIRFLLPFYLLAFIPLALMVEEWNTFSLTTATLTGLIFLALTLYTLVTRSLNEQRRLLDFDWFWICCGLTLYFSSLTGIDPILRLLLKDDPATYLATLNVKAVLDIIALLTIARGMLCPLPPLQSGGFSSPQSSAHLSYS